MIKTKAWMVRKLDPEQDSKVDAFWESLTLEERKKLATMDKTALVTKIKSKLKRRCTCQDCKFSKISYFDPQAKLIERYIHQIEMNACMCHRQHRDFSDDDHKNAEYLDNPTCKPFDTLLTTKIRIEGDKLFITPDVLTDDFFVTFRLHREWKCLIPAAIPLSLSPSCCPAEGSDPIEIPKRAEGEKEKEKKGEEKEKVSSKAKLGDIFKEDKEPPKSKVTCDECRSRINFEINVAAALEEKVVQAQRAKVLELQSKLVCDLLLEEEEKKKAKRTAGNRAHHHHCSHHKPSPPPPSKSKRRKSVAVDNGNEGESNGATVEESSPILYQTNNQVLIVDNKASVENEESFDPDDWTVVGKTKKKPDTPPIIPAQPVVVTVQDVPVAKARKPKSSSNPKPEPPKPVAQKQAEWKGWNLPPSREQLQQIQQIQQQVPNNSIAQLPQMDFTQDLTQFMVETSFKNLKQLDDDSLRAKVIRPPSPKSQIPSPRSVQEATDFLVSAIKVASSRSLLSSHYVELRSVLLESLRTLSIAGDSLLRPMCDLGHSQICCEEESCVPTSEADSCDLTEGCNCTYHTNCFSLPRLFESPTWTQDL